MGTVVVFLIVAALVFLAGRKIYLDKKQGKGCCGGNCSQCHGCRVPEKEPGSTGN
ncbi:MAG: FeoB-associated Cys-rich membrane protein [Candidatus Limivivens sp.]|nr:FeoB-associated Cys-rich membrane protein [Candidatus Limivivens sp.]